jgi:hypothetical protein
VGVGDGVVEGRAELLQRTHSPWSSFFVGCRAMLFTPSLSHRLSQAASVYRALSSLEPSNAAWEECHAKAEELGAAGHYEVGNDPTSASPPLPPSTPTPCSALLPPT